MRPLGRALACVAGAVVVSALVGSAVRLLVPARGVMPAEADGRRTRIIVRGRRGAPLAVLIHGLGGMAENFARLMPLLDGWRVLAPDRAGAGHSDPAPPGGAGIAAQAARIAALIEAERSGPAVILGHSLGGAVALQLAADRPDLVAGLVLCGGLSRGDHLRFARVLTRIGRVPFVREAWSRTLGAATMIVAAPWLTSINFAPGRMPPGFARWGGGLLALQPRAFSAAWRDIEVAACGIDALQPRLPAIAVPVTILHGVEDQVLGIHQARHLAALLPHARLNLIEDAGHMLPVTRPDLVAEAIRALG